MKEYQVENVRTIGLIGHGGTGKTSLTEAILFNTKETDRVGRVEDGTTISDYDPEERKRQISISAAVAPCEWNNHRIHIIDIPGYFDFVGELIQGINAVDAAVINVCGVSGAEVGTEKGWNYVTSRKIPRAFFINKLDRENSNFEKSFDSLKSKFGLSVVPIQIPIGRETGFKGIVNIIDKTAKVYDPKTRSMIDTEVASELVPQIDEYRNLLMEAVAETDEELLEKYLGEGELSNQDIIVGLRKGIASCDISPVFCGSATANIGVHTFLDSVVNYFPAPNYREFYEGKNPRTGNPEKRKITREEPFSAFVFKTIADPFVGRLSIFRVLSGTMSSDATIYNSTQDKNEKVGTLYLLKGKSQVPVTKLYAGDIGAVAKLQFTMTGDTISDTSNPVVYSQFEFPEPCISMAVKAKAKGDEDKISTGLHRLLEEDPTFKVSRDVENAEMIISGLGELHLEIIASKLKSKFGADVELGLPKIPYRETIKKATDVQGKYKKQSGGHGQYGDVWIKFEPQHETDDLMFVDQVVGGSVPRNFIPAVEKGLKEAVKRGVLAGYPVIGLKAILHDGSYHPVDSSEMAFKTAASMAFKKGIAAAQPILLEPIMHVEISIPDEYMGDIMGDINRRRGRVHGMEPVNGMQIVTAEIPMSELFRYATDLRSMTQSRGSFTMKFERYDEVPAIVSQKIIENSEKIKDDEE